MAPQRRSQRLQQAQAPVAAAPAVISIMPPAAGAQQCADSLPPPAKRPRKQNNSAAAPPLPAPMSQLEMERAARIAANKARLAELELPQMVAKLAALAPQRKSRAPASQRGVGTKRTRTEPLLPTRQSARTRGQAPDPTTAGGIDYETRDGRVVLAAFVPGRYGTSSSATGAAGGSSADSAGPARPPPGPLPFRSSNSDEATDAAFLQQLQAAAALGSSSSDSSAPISPSNQNGSGLLGVERLTSLSLAPVDVAKLTTQGISCLAFHPSSSRPVIAAADKSGKVGLWDIDAEAADAGGYDGVLMFTPHTDYVSSMKWLGPSGAGLLTGSYDGTVRRLDVASGVWELVKGVPTGADSNNWSAGDATPDGSTLYLATSDGQFTCVDTRANSTSSTSSPAGRELLISNRKVNTLQLHADQVHLLSSASDGSVAVWDVRNLAAVGSSNGRSKLCKPVAAGQHFKSSQGAYWEPSGGRRVLSISFDDTLRIWQLSGSALSQQVTMKHNNNTGRWVVPFRPAWAPAGDAVCVGDLKRGVAVFSDQGTLSGMLSAEALTAIPSRLALHPQGMLAAATSSGRVHIFR